MGAVLCGLRLRVPCIAEVRGIETDHPSRAVRDPSVNVNVRVDLKRPLIVEPRVPLRQLEVPVEAEKAQSDVAIDPFVRESRAAWRELIEGVIVLGSAHYETVFLCVEVSNILSSYSIQQPAREVKLSG